MRVRWVVVYEYPDNANGEAYSYSMRFSGALNYIRIFRDASHLELVAPKRFAGLRIPRRFIWGKL